MTSDGKSSFEPLALWAKINMIWHWLNFQTKIIIQWINMYGIWNFYFMMTSMVNKGMKMITNKSSNATLSLVEVVLMSHCLMVSILKVLSLQILPEIKKNNTYSHCFVYPCLVDKKGPWSEDMSGGYIVNTQGLVCRPQIVHNHQCVVTVIQYLMIKIKFVNKCKILFQAM